jgi:hypothetical protein
VSSAMPISPFTPRHDDDGALKLTLAFASVQGEDTALTKESAALTAELIRVFVVEVRAFVEPCTVPPSNSSRLAVPCMMLKCSAPGNSARSRGRQDRGARAR